MVTAILDNLSLCWRRFSLFSQGIFSTVVLESQLRCLRLFFWISYALMLLFVWLWRYLSSLRSVVWWDFSIQDFLEWSMMCYMDQFRGAAKELSGKACAGGGPLFWLIWFGLKVFYVECLISAFYTRIWTKSRFFVRKVSCGRDGDSPAWVWVLEFSSPSSSSVL